MPTYEYLCPKGHEFEVFQRMSDEPGAPCPTCGEAGERQLSGGAGFLFKGSGFYITDYRSDDYKKKASQNESSSSDGSDSSGDSKKDSNKDSNKDSKKESKNESKSESSTSSKKGGADSE
jgi:putative FmdB family regulatory protein